MEWWGAAGASRCRAAPGLLSPLALGSTEGIFFLLAQVVEFSCSSWRSFTHVLFSPSGRMSTLPFLVSRDKVKGDKVDLILSEYDVNVTTDSCTSAITSSTSSTFICG